MTQGTSELTVTQSDREAAASFYQDYLARPGEVPVAAAFRVGHVDESPLIQAFARHRLAALNSAQQPAPAGDAELRGEAVCDIAAELRTFAMNMRRDDTDARSDSLRFYYEAIEGFADRFAATPPSVPAQQGWLPIETCPMWEVAVVTDGESAAVSQKAEADYGGHYWAVDPEDALEWEPSHWMPLPATPTPDQTNEVTHER